MNLLAAMCWLSRDTTKGAEIRSNRVRRERSSEELTGRKADLSGRISGGDEQSERTQAGWRRRLLFSVCDLPKGRFSGKDLARAYSPAAGNSASRLR
jgi:hypothetical protein